VQSTASWFLNVMVHYLQGVLSVIVVVDVLWFWWCGIRTRDAVCCRVALVWLWAHRFSELPQVSGDVVV
jgi:hypothetical protein